ncbi:MAG: hypothetical protein M0Z36_08960 [Thermaerobacter sp.]|nr:hypothetical protein [Thermaerobacter sp.]
MGITTERATESAGQLRARLIRLADRMQGLASQCRLRMTGEDAEYWRGYGDVAAIFAIELEREGEER